MANIICSNIVASISELKSNPMATIESAGGEPIAILNRNHPVFYCVPAALYEQIIDTLDDIQLAKIVQERQNEPEIPLTLDDL